MKKYKKKGKKKTLKTDCKKKNKTKIERKKQNKKRRGVGCVNVGVGGKGALVSRWGLGGEG